MFRATMNAVEFRELLQATASRYFQTTIVEGCNVKPVPVANGQGFRFETRMVGRNEVERDGVFVGTIRKPEAVRRLVPGVYSGLFSPE